MRHGHAEGRQRQLPRDVVKRVQELGGVPESLLGIAHGGPGDELVEEPRHAADAARRGGHVVVEARVGVLEGRLPVERGGAREQLEEHHAGGVDVAGRRQLVAAHLLGREVSGRADDLVGAPGGHARGAHQAEVGELDRVVRADEHVVRLEVAVDHVRRVRGREPREHRAHHRGGRVRRHRPALGEQLAQSASRDQLHDQEDHVAVRAEVVDADEVGVRQLRHRAGLAAEAVAEDGVVDVAVVHHLHGDRARETHVHAAVDGGHAAARDGVVDAVPPLEHVADLEMTHGYQYGGRRRRGKHRRRAARRAHSLESVP